jgi:hypothetical protein
MGSNLEGLSSDVLGLTYEVLGELRAAPNDLYDSLTSRQQSKFSELGDACLSHIIDSPYAPDDLAKLGPNQNAYSLTLAELKGALLRVHFYTADGAFTVYPDSMKGIVDVEKFGTPHTHRGHISSVVPVGCLTHYCFNETDGLDYMAGNLRYEDVGDATGNYLRTVIEPHHQAGLEYLGALAFDNGNGYLMNKKAIHVISWREPTVTVFLSDFTEPHTATIYQPSNTCGEIERRWHPLTPAEREQVWRTFQNVVSEGLK